MVPFGSIEARPSVDPYRLIGAQRFDVLCRCVVAALLCSRCIRRDSTFVAALAKPSWTTRVGQALLRSLDGTLPEEAGPTGVLRVSGPEVQRLSPDEQRVGMTLAQVFAAQGARTAARAAAAGASGHAGWCRGEVPSLRRLLWDLLASGPAGQQASPALVPPHPAVRLLVLREDAQRHVRDELVVAKAEGIERLVFVLGDHVGLRPMASGRLITDFGGRAVSLGHTSLLTSHCITVLQFLVDRHWRVHSTLTRGA